jgi:hypothetical protein
MTQVHIWDNTRSQPPAYYSVNKNFAKQCIELSEAMWAAEMSCIQEAQVNAKSQKNINPN